MSELTGLILTPFTSKHRNIHKEIELGLDAEGIRVIRLDDIILPGALLASAITDAIKKADFIIADLTEANPNIMYEIGFAHALEKQVFLIVSESSNFQIPFNLTGYHYLFYKAPYELTHLVRSKILPYVERIKEERQGDE